MGWIDPAFLDCLVECASNPVFVREFNRLSGTSLFKKRSTLERMIDKACGYDPDEKDIGKFIEFVFEFVWMPLMKEARDGTQA